MHSVTVKQGSAHVNNIRLLQQTTKVIAYYIAFHERHIQIDSFGSTDGEVSIYPYAVNNNKEPTSISFEVPICEDNQKWIITYRKEQHSIIVVITKVAMVGSEIEFIEVPPT